MKFEYALAFMFGVDFMALLSAFSLGAVPCRTLAFIALLIAETVIAAAGFLIGRRSCRKQVQRRSYNKGVRRGMMIGRAERQSEIQQFLENE